MGALTHVCDQRSSDAYSHVAVPRRPRRKCGAERMAEHSAPRCHSGGRCSLFFGGNIMRSNLSPQLVEIARPGFPYIVEIELDAKNIKTEFVLVCGFHRQRGIRTKRIERITSDERIYLRYCFARRAIADQFAAEFCGKVVEQP
jgi:hypothetical protein